VKQIVLVHYHEINLKGKNRGRFEACLQHNIASALNGLPHESIYRFGGRLIVELGENPPLAEIARRLKTIFGIANFAFAWTVPAEIKSIQEGLAQLVNGSGEFDSFKIDARRGTKTFPLNSQQLNTLLGSFVQQLTHAAVRLENPQVVFFVEIVGHRAFLYRIKSQGAGGLPSGTGGKVLSLISGGIDSPVASFRLMRRGCRVTFIHFHSFPHTTIESQEKVKRILRILSCYQSDSTLFLVPFAEVQREIVARAPAAMRVILYRRFMLRIAEAVALREKAAALVTGDSLGQVASQTLENIRTISAAVNIPIFRPLIGDDKEDIIRIARAIGTYEISIQADQDCCSLFVPKHPETMCSPEQAQSAEAGLDTSRLVQDALNASLQESVKPDYSLIEGKL